jgi:hypothetical protein
MMLSGPSQAMSTFSNTDSDIPLGRFGRLVGLRVVVPDLHEGEEVRWSARTNMLQYRSRAVGGRLYLTDQRLVFGRSRLESFLGGKEWKALLENLASATVGEGRRDELVIESNEGVIERFLTKETHQAAEFIEAAISELGKQTPHSF